jgi:hypothetical protein
MICTSEQETIPLMEAPDTVISKEHHSSEEIQDYDEESRQIRKHIAQEKALRQFEHRKSLALAEVHRMSFNT